MIWTMFLRRCLMARLMDPHLGGKLRIIIAVGGSAVEAEKVLPTAARDVLKNYLDGNANAAERVKVVVGGTEIQKTVLDGYATINDTIMIEGDVEFMIELAAKLEEAEVTKSGASMMTVYIPIKAEPATSRTTGTNGATGDVRLNIDTDGLLVVSYQYTTEDNEAGGTTYTITSDYYMEDGGTMYIGGKYGG